MQDEKQDELLKGLRTNFRTLPLSRADRAMLIYVMKLTVAPKEMSAGDVNTLRAEGFDDRGIHDICAITAYFAFVNRIADGLGVELEDP